MSKKIKVWTCEKCVQPRPCGRFSIFKDGESYTPVGCNLSKDGDVVPVWKLTTKYQITEVPEPVYYLDMPKDIKRVDAFLAAELEVFNGKDVKITTKHKGTYCECQFNPFNPQTKTKVSRRDWIKQKQPEPTREELQIRIDKILSTAKDIGASETGRINRIIDIAAGGKP